MNEDAKRIIKIKLEYLQVLFDVLNDREHADLKRTVAAKIEVLNELQRDIEAMEKIVQNPIPNY